MLILPPEIMTILTPFMQVFSPRVWDWAQILLVGAILAPGKRTVTSALRVLGLKDEKQYQNYHRVLNRAKWSSLQVSQILLGLLITVFVSAGVPIVLGADETLERRWGRKIKAKGIFRDAARSSQKYTNYSNGLRWVSMMLLVAIPWSDRVWALPFLTVLAPSPKTNAANNKRHKSSIDWVGQMVGTVRRWLPEREIVLVVDGGMAAVKLGLRCAGYEQSTTMVSRLRMDAMLHLPPGPQSKSKPGPKPKKGERVPSLAQVLVDPDTEWAKQEIDWYSGQKRLIEFVSGTNLWYTPSSDPLPIRWLLVRDPLDEFRPTAFFATDQNAKPLQILDWYIMRWGVEVTFEEARAHLGLETQRQWSDLAIQRSTPALLGLFSLITLLAHQLSDGKPPVQKAAWYVKPNPTFSDAIALVRFHLWTSIEFVNSPAESRFRLISDSILPGLVESICYAT
ncbi:MAG: transposase [Candidatus Promineifilaceae bacterium]